MMAGFKGSKYLRHTKAWYLSGEVSTMSKIYAPYSFKPFAIGPQSFSDRKQLLLKSLQYQSQ